MAVLGFNGIGLSGHAVDEMNGIYQTAEALLKPSSQTYEGTPAV